MSRIALRNREIGIAYVRVRAFEEKLLGADRPYCADRVTTEYPIANDLMILCITLVDILSYDNELFGLLMYDLIVIGARCAGAPTAMLLARKGYQYCWSTKRGEGQGSVSRHRKVV
jgi:hypothetical protein